MKSEHEIRRHLKNLMAAVELRCDCATPEERQECANSKLAMMSECVALIWAIGDLGAGMHQKSVDELDRAIKAMHAESN